MPSHSTLVTMISALAAVTGSFAAGSVHADACDPLYQAGIKSIQTPHHVYSTTTPRAASRRAARRSTRAAWNTCNCTASGCAAR